MFSLNTVQVIEISKDTLKFSTMRTSFTTPVCKDRNTGKDFWLMSGAEIVFNHYFISTKTKISAKVEYTNSNIEQIKLIYELKVMKWINTDC